MKLANKWTHRALAFIAAMNKRGYYPTADEIDRYVTTWEPDLEDPIAAWAFSPGIRNGELTRKYLTDVGWIEAGSGDADRFAITEYGSRVLYALNDAQGVQRRVIEITVNPEDRLAVSRAVGHLRNAGRGLLVDPYSRWRQVELISKYTQIDRVLRSDDLEPTDRTALVHALASGRLERPVEVRLADQNALHDRYVIPSTGPVSLIGGYINTMGRRRTAIVELRDVADEIRQRYERLWDDAEPLVPPVGAIQREVVSEGARLTVGSSPEARE